MCRQVDRVAHIIGGHGLMAFIKHGCKRCRFLELKSVEVVMGPVQNVNLCIAPAFYASQVDIFGPFKCFSPANKRATLKIWFLIFCYSTTGAVFISPMEDYSTTSFVMGFVQFSCRYGYPRYLLPDAGSQLVKGCQDIEYSFVDSKQILSVEYGVDFSPCPVGAQYFHGRVERKIRAVRKSVQVAVQKERLSTVQWETLMCQISNSINNMPIGLKSNASNLDNLDLLTREGDRQQRREGVEPSSAGPAHEIELPLHHARSGIGGGTCSSIAANGSVGVGEDAAPAAREEARRWRPRRVEPRGLTGPCSGELFPSVAGPAGGRGLNHAVF